MPKLIDISCRRSVLCASNNNITRIDTVPRHIFKQISLKAQGERTSTTASCHSYCTTAAASAQPRLHYTLNRPRPSYTWTRRPSKCLKHQRQRCFTRGARAGRGLGVDRRRDGWDSLQGLWDEEVDYEQDRYQDTIGGPRREVIQVNNGEIELDSVGILLYRTMQATQAIQDPLHDTTQTNTLPTISIYHPRLSRPQNQYPPQSQPASHLNTRNPIILYLGAWPSSQSSINQASIKDSARAQTLAHSANATVVQVHYRDCTYPQPVHDVLAAWDWIGAQLGRDGMKLGGGEGGAEGKGGSMGMGMGMGVYGNEVGGSLALMLGMTECDAGVSEVAQPSMHDHGAATGRASPETGKPHIRAVAVHDPIVDWVFPQAELDSDAPPATSAGSAPTSNLIALRAQAFRASTHPSSYFDPFASPIHFLRTPSAAIPPATVSYTSTPPAETSGNGKAVDDEFDVLARLEEETLSSLRPLLVSEGSQTQTQTLTQSQMQIPTPPSTASVSGPASGITEETLYIDTTVRRKVPLRWPPSSLPRTARMPWFSITVSEDDPPLRDTEAASTAQPNPLLAQVTEMARLLRRAYVKYCLPREFGREEEHEGTDAADLRSLVRAGDKVVEDRVLRDIMASEADNLSSDTKSKSGSRRKKREVQDTEEDEHERALRQRISTVRRLARERVVFEVVPGRGDGVGNGEEECEDEEQGMDADEQQRKGRRPYVQDAAEEEEEMDEMAETREMDEIEKVGRWMGEMLRR